MNAPSLEEQILWASRLYAAQATSYEHSLRDPSVNSHMAMLAAVVESLRAHAATLDHHTLTMRWIETPCEQCGKVILSDVAVLKGERVLSEIRHDQNDAGAI